MKILIVSATPFEIAPLINHLEQNWTKKSFFEFTNGDKSITTLVTGVGGINTAFAMSRYNGMESIDLVLNAGIAGSLSNNISIGSVVEVVKDKFADIGVEEADGTFSDHFDMGWESPTTYPYTNGWLANTKSKYDCGLIKVSGISVNTVHGTNQSISMIKNKYDAHIETMEGAAFSMACLLNDAKFHQVRAISNMVEERNKANWQIENAINNLNATIIKLLDQVTKESI